MKSILIIGLGDFGHHLCRQLVKLKNQVFVVDKSEQALDDVKDIASTRLVADCSSKAVLENIGVSNFDICFVCIDSDFKSNLIIVSLLKELNAKYVISQTNDDILDKFLLKSGADEIIYPNKDSAIRAAVKYSSEHIFDYIEIKSEYSIYEISPVKSWINKSIIESNIREKYDTYIIGIIDEFGKTLMMPAPKTIIKATDHLMVLAHDKTIEKLLKKM